MKKELKCREAEQMVIPYINEELSHGETKAFLDHIDGCSSCQEELEVYYTIYRALDQLEKDPDVSYDIHQLMQENIRTAKQRVYRIDMTRFFRRLIGATAVAALLISIIMQIELWGQKDIYSLLNRSTVVQETAK